MPPTRSDMGLTPGQGAIVGTDTRSHAGTVHAVYGAGDAPLALAIRTDEGHVILIPWVRVLYVRLLTPDDARIVSSARVAVRR